MFKVFGNFIIQSHGLFYQEVTDRLLLMSIHHFRFQCIIFGCSESGNGLHFRECLKTILAHKAWNLGIKTLKRLLSIPSAPIMAVGYLPTFRTPPVGFVRRAMHIKTIRVKFLYLARQQFTEQFVVSSLHTFHDGRVGIFLVPSPIAHSFIDFIISTPHGQTCMIAQTLDIVVGFRLHTLQESRIRRISGTSKNEVLPNQDTVFIGFLIKSIILIHTAPPYTKHVHIGLFHILE